MKIKNKQRKVVTDVKANGFKNGIYTRRQVLDALQGVCEQLIQLYQLTICLVYSALNQRSLYHFIIVKVHSKFCLVKWCQENTIRKYGENSILVIKSSEFTTNLSWSEFHLSIPLTCKTSDKLPNLSVPQLRRF